MNSYSASKKQRELLAIQKLYVKLYFCKETLEKFRENSLEVLHKFHISPERIALFQDTKKKRFSVESHGRRFMIAKELFGRFPRFFCSMIQMAPSVNSVMKELVFTEFLSSDSFFLPDHSFPHPYGIGKGYENVSKFFLWIVMNMRNEATLKALKIDFSIYLVQLAQHSEMDFYKRFKNGIFFHSSNSNNKERVMLMTPKGRVLQLRDVDKTVLLSRGTVDLDLILGCNPISNEKEKIWKKNHCLMN